MTANNALIEVSENLSVTPDRLPALGWYLTAANRLNEAQKVFMLAEQHGVMFVEPVIGSTPLLRADVSDREEPLDAR